MQFRTPLHWAAVLGLTEVVGILMEHGADPNLPDAVGASALHYAVSHWQTLRVLDHIKKLAPPTLTSRRSRQE